MSEPSIAIKEAVNRKRRELIHVCLFTCFTWGMLFLMSFIASSIDLPMRLEECAATNMIDVCSLPANRYILFSIIFIVLAFPASMHICLTVYCLKNEGFFWQRKNQVLMIIGILFIATPLVLIVKLWGAHFLTVGTHKLFHFMDWYAHAFEYVMWVCVIGGNIFLQLIFITWRRSSIQTLNFTRMQKERAELRLHLLQEQLKPNFLFNALNSIGFLVRDVDRQLAGTALSQLNGLLRYVAYASKHEWTNVADEIQFLRDYLEMQRLRFGERLCVEWEIQDGHWQSIQCASLLFQALAENAIHHGVEPHHEKSLIRLEVRHDGKDVFFTICNTVFPGTPLRKGYGLGLSNTRERIELLYGHRAHLTIFKTQNHFTLELVFPLNQQ